MAQGHDNESNDEKMASYDTYFGIMFVIVPRVSGLNIGGSSLLSFWSHPRCACKLQHVKTQEI